jgi:hypothetical protein
MSNYCPQKFYCHDIECGFTIKLFIKVSKEELSVEPFQGGQHFLSNAALNDTLLHHNLPHSLHTIPVGTSVLSTIQLLL